MRPAFGRSRTGVGTGDSHDFITQMFDLIEGLYEPPEPGELEGAVLHVSDRD